jgi:hypothetical protein
MQESLIWKLAGLVQFAATKGDADGQHAFYTQELPALFERFIVQLRDLSAPRHSTGHIERNPLQNLCFYSHLLCER